MPPLPEHEYFKESISDAVKDVALALPMLPIPELPQIIEQHRAEGRRAMRRAVRDWAKRKGGQSTQTCSNSGCALE